MVAMTADKGRSMARTVEQAAEEYAAALAADDVPALIASLAPDATFTSPFSHWHRPQDVARVYRTRARAFDKIRVDHITTGADAFVVAFAARVGGVDVYGAEVVTVTEDGAPREIRALFQPASALPTIYERMTALW